MTEKSFESFIQFLIKLYQLEEIKDKLEITDC